jgi:5-methylcytosine-specific restriction endonuclease McrA
MKTPKRLRRSRNSSGTAICPICLLSAILHEHHINGRDIPDANKSWNLVSICPNCHVLTHENCIIIEGWFTTTEGRKLIWHRKDEKSITDNNTKPHIINRKRINI